MRTLRRFLPLVFVLVPLALTPTAHAATTLSVCAACTYTTIQDAVDAAVDGDTIDVAAGTYAENVIVNTSVTILGAKAGVDGRTRVGAAGETIIDGGLGHAIEGAGADLVVDGVTLTVSPQTTLPGPFAGIVADQNLTVRNVVISAGTNGVTVDASGTESLLIERSSITVGRFGADLKNLASAAIRTTNIATNSSSGSGVQVATTGTLEVSGSSLKAGSTAEGIYVLSGGAGGVTLVDNVIDDYSPSVRVGTTVTGTVSITRNRFERRTSTADAVYNGRATAVSAPDNWFDCAGAPSTCSALGGSGTTDVPTWITAAVTSPATAYRTAAIPVSLQLRRSDGSAMPAQMTTMEGVVAAFSASDPGTFSPTSAAIASSAASSTFATSSAGLVTFTADISGAKFTSTTEVRVPTSTNVTPVKLGATPRFGTAVTCSPGTWNPVLNVNWTYSWKRDATVIAGAAAQTYTPVAADVGHLLTCIVSTSSRYQDTTTGSTVAAKVLKRQPVLALPQTTATGVAMACGASVAKPCAVKRRSLAYAKLTAHASHPGTVRAGLVIELKSGRRWVPRKPVMLTFGTKALSLGTRLLAPGTYRFRIVFAGNATDLPARSAYRYFRVR